MRKKYQWPLYFWGEGKVKNKEWRTPVVPKCVSWKKREFVVRKHLVGYTPQIGSKETDRRREGKGGRYLWEPVPVAESELGRGRKVRKGWSWVFSKGQEKYGLLTGRNEGRDLV